MIEINLYSITLSSYNAMHSLANNVGFKQQIPKFPKNENTETVRGFESRYKNWLKELTQKVKENELNKIAASHSSKAKKLLII